jgi:hypothetical protein
VDDDQIFCPQCGCDWPGCGCPDTDPGTMALMRCPDGQRWWRQHNDTSTGCLHPGCGKPSVVEREPKYAPNPAAA